MKRATMKLTERDLERIQQAVGEVEKKTRGEIVPVLLSHSGTYPETWWYLAAAGAGLSGVFSFSIHEFLG